MANVVVATGVLPVELARQRRHQSLRRERQQPAVRYLVEAMTERVVAVQRQSSPLLGIGCLKSGITAVGVGAKLIYIPKTLIERPLVLKRREASITNRLIAIELHLERLMKPSRAYKIHSQVPMQTELLLNAKVVLVVIRCLECPTREGVQADRQRACWCACLQSRTGSAARAKSLLERIVRVHRGVNCTSSNTGSDTDAAG